MLAVHEIPRFACVFNQISNVILLFLRLISEVLGNAFFSAVIFLSPNKPLNNYQSRHLAKTLFQLVYDLCFFSPVRYDNILKRGET